jgi:hypothetical protein
VFPVRYDLNLYVMWKENRPHLWSRWSESLTAERRCVVYVQRNRPPLWSSGHSSWLQNGDVFCFL